MSTSRLRERFSCSVRRAARGWLRVLFAFSLILAGQSATADEKTASEQEPIEEAAAPLPPPPAGRTTDEIAARQRAFTMGVVMLGGIVICGVGLLSIVLLWGNRTRRIARQPLPSVAPRDELWYLKHRIEPDRPANDSDTDDSAG